MAWITQPVIQTQGIEGGISPYCTTTVTVLYSEDTLLRAALYTAIHRTATAMCWDETGNRGHALCPGTNSGIDLWFPTKFLPRTRYRWVHRPHEPRGVKPRVNVHRRVEYNSGTELLGASECRTQHTEADRFPGGNGNRPVDPLPA